jgi:hypothetical protein
LDFGYSPTYNILDYLSKINPNSFTSSSVLSILPQFTGLTGMGLVTTEINGLTFSKTKLSFDSNHQFEWTSLLINTFVDLYASG